MPSRLRILYVEDQFELRDAIGAVLQILGHEVTLCESAEDALEVLRDREFDVLVTDVSLPGMSGTDLARRVLRAQPEHWVVLCSGYEFRHGLATLGPNVRALTKSFEPEVMQRTMEDIAAALQSARP